VATNQALYTRTVRTQNTHGRPAAHMRGHAACKANETVMRACGGLPVCMDEAGGGKQQIITALS